MPEPIDEYLVDLDRRLCDDRAQSGRERRRLVEEVAAHLDPFRREALFASLAALGSQVFMTGADAALCASIFHYGRHTIAEAKAYLVAAGIPVRVG